MIARIVLLLSLVATPAFAQDVPNPAPDAAPVVAPVARRPRRPRPPPWTAPVAPVLVGTGGRYGIALGLVASGEVEVVTDARLFSIEVTEPAPAPEPGSRRRARRPRTHTCRMPGRVGARETLASRGMSDGAVWGVGLDLRVLCWGRALSALEAGGTVTVRYRAPARRGAFVASSLATDPDERARTVRELSAPSSFVLAPESDERGPITLAPVDAARRGFSLRVAVYGPEARARRVWIRPDRISFRVVDPAGGEWRCALPRSSGAAIPDLFARFSATRPVRFTLDAAQYCPDEVFERAGIYEVTPIVDLDEDGAAWRLDAVVGHFEGRAVPVRFRGGEGALFTELEGDVARRTLR